MKKENALKNRLFYLFKNLGYFISIEKPIAEEVYKEDLENYLSSSEIANQIIAQISSLRGDWFSIINTFRDYLMNGISLKGQNKTIFLMDWKQPENNIFRFSFFSLKEKKLEKLWIIYVNGLPLVLLNLETCFKDKYSQICKKLSRNLRILKYEFPNKVPFLFRCLQLIVCSNYHLCFYSHTWSASIFQWLSVHQFHPIRILFGNKVFNFCVKNFRFRNIFRNYFFARSIVGFSTTILNRNELLNTIKNQIYISDLKNNKGFSNILLEQHVRASIEKTIQKLRSDKKFWVRCDIDKELKFPLSVTFLLQKIITNPKLKNHSIVYLTFEENEAEDEITKFVLNSKNFLEGVSLEIIKWEDQTSIELEENKIYVSNFKKWMENIKKIDGTQNQSIFLIDERSWLINSNQVSFAIKLFRNLNKGQLRNHPFFYLLFNFLGKKQWKSDFTFWLQNWKILFLNFY